MSRYSHFFSRQPNSPLRPSTRFFGSSYSFSHLIVLLQRKYPRFRQRYVCIDILKILAHSGFPARSVFPSIYCDLNTPDCVLLFAPWNSLWAEVRVLTIDVYKFVLCNRRCRELARVLCRLLF